jgi:flagellar biosynthesis protein FlhA
MAAKSGRDAVEGFFTLAMLKNPDLVMAMGVIGIMFLMILPISPVILDICLTISFASSVVILMVAIYTTQPLKFSVFPSLLLVTTLFRLSLNIASTRVILLHGSEGPGAAGHVIMSFGNFVVGGNYAVGLIVFLILVIINFVVITKGSGRIAEVSARFTLDAMPGKQMSIDADLNAGLIDDVEAKRRRKEIASEADFYGAMDGSSKFIRGDAVAAIAVTVINIVGGFFIGILQNHMAFADALKTYTLLTIGDGLVAQIPALIVSTAAGLVMTRAAGESNLGENIFDQVFVQYKAIGSASGILIIFGLIPGLPHLPFIMLGCAGLALAWVKMNKEAEDTALAEEAPAPVKAAPERIEDMLKLDVLSLEVGYGLITIADSEQGGFQDRIRALRKQFATELGIVVPPIHIRDNLQLKPNMYRILLKGNEVAKDEVMPGHFMALDSGAAAGAIEGISANDPAFGLPAVWIKQGQKERAKVLGYTVVDPVTVLVTHLAEALRVHAHELLGRQEVQSLVDTLAEAYPKVVGEIVPDTVSVGMLQKVLQSLLKERVCVRDLLTILETLADVAPVVKDTEILTEYVRQALSRTISRQYMNKDNTLKVITLEPSLEEALSNAFKKTPQGAYLAIEPEVVQGLLDSIGRTVQRSQDTDATPVILCGAKARPPLRKLIERHFPHLPVLSHNEISDNVRVHTVGEVRLAYAD